MRDGGLHMNADRQPGQQQQQEQQQQQQQQDVTEEWEAAKRPANKDDEKQARTARGSGSAKR